jgi:hypothetical protein
MAPYYWPNPNTKDGLPYIVKDGERNPELNNYDAPKLTELVNRMKILALAFYIT